MEQYHPIINFIYFGLVIGCSMVFLHPVCLLISITCAAYYTVVLFGKRRAVKGFGGVAVLMLLTALINPTFSHQGITELCELPGGNMLTLESILFGIGAAIPPISGIIISCLDNNLRGDGFSICNLLNNLIGSFPSSYVYALLVDAFKKEKEEDRYRYAWMITMGYNFIGLMWVIIAGIFRYKIKGDLSEKKEEKNNLIDDEKNNEVKKDD